MAKNYGSRKLPSLSTRREDSSSSTEMQRRSLLRPWKKEHGGRRDSDMSSEDDTRNHERGEESDLEFQGYRKCKCKIFVSWTSILLTGGLLRLLYHWFPRLHLYSTHAPCPLTSATKVLVVESFQKKFKNYYVKDIKTSIVHGLKKDAGECLDDVGETPIHRKGKERKIKFYLSDGAARVTESIRHFKCKKQCYIWDEDCESFLKLSGLDVGLRNGDFHRLGGLTEQEQTLRQIAYGPNEIAIPVQGVWTLLILEVLNPFYVFQLFSLIIWGFENYYYYAVAIIIMSVFGVTTSVIQTRRNQKKLRRTVTSSDVVTVIRKVEDGEEKEVKEEILAKNLVPGDVIALHPYGFTLSCDAVLLSGNAIVNESMLTGESVPVTKVPIPNDEKKFEEKDDNIKHSVLFCGTKVLQTRFYGNEWARAVVLRTGFLTTKGQIVQTILYPPPVDYRFERDSYKFVFALSFIAIGGFIYSAITKALRGNYAGSIAIKALDLITIAVPPALPAAMTVGKMYAQRRLEKKGIFCINSRVINVSGSVNCVCYDKTGTLTEDGLNMWGVIPVKDKEMQSPITEFPLSGKSSDKGTNMIEENEHFLVAMASCHSLTYLDRNLIGDPLDIKMYESTGWILEEPEMSETAQYDLLIPLVVRPSDECIISTGEDQDFPFEVGIIRQFHFSSHLQRMSVITRRLGSRNFNIYCKGSPEMLISLSKPDTVPTGISTTMEFYTKKGYRVLALAWKPLPPEFTVVQIHRLKREQVEMDFIFLGLLLFENRLKKGTAPVIANLNKAKIKQIMVTGDNILTAISVAHECGLVSSKQQVYQLEPPVMVNSNGSVTNDFTWAAKNIFKEDDVIELKAESIGDSMSHSNDPTDKIDENIEIDLEKGKSSLTCTYALTGTIWAELKEHHPQLLKKIVKSGKIYARMTPAQKQQLVQELQATGLCVAMCGDGANDCGALKAAHAGISLSEAESSAASPFTSNGEDISCVPHVISEGRAALVTSFGIFKFMAVYSLTQFASVILLYSIDSNLTDFQFLYIDLMLVTVSASLFGLTGPPNSKKSLAPRPPSARLFSPLPIISIVLQVVFMVMFHCLLYFGVRFFPWYIPFIYEMTTDPSDNVSCYENYSVFAISSFQYVWMAVIFSRGAPHRKNILTNRKLVLSLFIMCIINAIAAVIPPNWMANLLQLVVPPSLGDRLLIIPCAALNFILCLLLEWGLMEKILEQGKPKLLWIKRKDLSFSKQSIALPCKALTSTNSSNVANQLSEKEQGFRKSDNPATSMTHL
ncbi:polyamine-transporting ATPase 13A3-like [Hetaerina americana]|uniref:polyamine-transporting ATPase 13A3-like n=1 Tax=Hetaerina americana TaxID=62018 RepID=UPI003A7F3FCC